jgi:hypothetical protein
VVVVTRVLPASTWPAAVVGILQIRILVCGSVRVVGRVEWCRIRDLQMRERATCEGEDRVPIQRPHDVVGTWIVGLTAKMLGVVCAKVVAIGKCGGGVEALMSRQQESLQGAL